MTTKQREAAQVCRRMLINRIGNERYELWFSTDQSISVSASADGTSKLVVAAENEFSSQCQQRNFRKEISDIACQLLGDNTPVVFCVKANAKASPVKAESGNSAESLTANTEPTKRADSTEKVDSFGSEKETEAQKTSTKVNEQEVEKEVASVLSIDNGPAKVADGQQFHSSPTSKTAEENCYNRASAERGSQTGRRRGPANQGTTNQGPANHGTTNQGPANHGNANHGNANQVEEQSANVGCTSNSGSREFKRRWETLDTFVTDSRNNVAAVSAARVVDCIGEVSPVFLCGPTGSGKTHLLEGIYCAARQRLRPGRVLYMSSAQYTTQFLEHLNQRTMPMFRHRFQDIEVLMIDDIQFFENKQATRVELVQLLDTLARGGRQLVLTADRNLSELGFLGSELLTRISSGLVCPIDYPSIEGRREIVALSARRRKIQLTEHVIELLAERIVGDVRHIRGALNRLHACYCATGHEITVQRASEWLADIFQNASRIPTLKEIESAVCNMFNLDDRSLRSDRKHRSITHPRMLAMWLSRKYTRAALSEIGDHFGGRSHSTVLSAKRKVNGWMDKGECLQTSNGELSVEDAIRCIETRLHVG